MRLPWGLGGEVYCVSADAMNRVRTTRENTWKGCRGAIYRD